jgi:ATP-dependent Clp protease ATP-binding subunit ClpC
MPKINVYLPDELAAAVRDAELPVSAICQTALERAVRDVTSVRATDDAPPEDHAGLGVLSRFTPRARQALVLAEYAARDTPHDHVGTEHLLLGIIGEGGNLGVRVLESLDVEPDDVRRELIASIEPPTTAPADADPVPFTPLAKEALEATAKEALVLGHNYIGCEHLLLGLLATEEGLASRVLRRMGVELRTTRRAVVAALVGYAQAQAAQAQAHRPAGSRPAPDPALAEILRRLDAIEERISRAG